MRRRPSVYAVAPPATAAVVQARYRGDSSAIPGIAAIMPAAIVIATVAEPTQIRTRAATINAVPVPEHVAKQEDIDESKLPNFWTIVGIILIPLVLIIFKPSPNRFTMVTARV